MRSMWPSLTSIVTVNITDEDKCILQYTKTLTFFTLQAKSQFTKNLGGYICYIQSYRYWSLLGHWYSTSLMWLNKGMHVWMLACWVTSTVYCHILCGCFEKELWADAIKLNSVFNGIKEILVNLFANDFLKIIGRPIYNIGKCW